MNIPPFIDKLKVYNEILEPKSEFRWDEKLRKSYYRWEFCEHSNQTAIEFPMAGMLGWKERISKNYRNKFENFIKFLPLSNQWMSSDYDKTKAIEEIQTYNQLENGQYQYRVNQFIALLKKSIEMNQEIYWD